MPATTPDLAPPLLLAIGTWRPTRRAAPAAVGVGRGAAHAEEEAVQGEDGAAARLRRALPSSARIRTLRDLVLLDTDDARVVLTALDATARAKRFAFALVIGTPGARDFTAIRLLERAARLPWGLAARKFPTVPVAREHAEAVEALLALYLSIARDRSEREWAAIDATRRTGTRTAAAAELGLTHQAVSQRLRVAHHKATERTALALAALLQHQAAAEGEG